MLDECCSLTDICMSLHERICHRFNAHAASLRPPISEQLASCHCAADSLGLAASVKRQPACCYASSGVGNYCAPEGWTAGPSAREHTGGGYCTAAAAAAWRQPAGSSASQSKCLVTGCIGLANPSHGRSAVQADEAALKAIEPDQRWAGAVLHELHFASAHPLRMATCMTNVLSGKAGTLCSGQ